MKEINTVNQKSLPERTADAIVAMLHMENYKAGAKLPNEIQMAQSAALPSVWPKGFWQTEISWIFREAPELLFPTSLVSLMIHLASR